VLLSWPEIRMQFLPTGARWMNLIEPWWKQLKRLALKGHRFDTADEIRRALAYWTSTGGPIAGERCLTCSRRHPSAGTDPS
jgi:hypothetical protein